MSTLSHEFYVIIDRGIISPRHGREVVDVLNYIANTFLFQLMSTVQLQGEKRYDTQMVMYTGTRTSHVILASNFQKKLSTAARKHGVIDQGKYKKTGK